MIPCAEESRGGLFHAHIDVGAGPPDADVVRDPQHGAVAALFQPAQPGIQQQG